MIKKYTRKKAISKFLKRLDYYIQNWDRSGAFDDYTYCEKSLCFFVCLIWLVIILVRNVIATITVPIWAIPYIFIKYREDKQ